MRREILTVLALAALVGVAHGWSVRGGLFLDDHSHFAHLRDGDWSFAAAVEAAHLGIVGEVMDIWGRAGSGLRFFRPIAFWVMKAEYTLLGWPVDGGAGIHLFSMAGHLLAGLLVVHLAYRLLRRWSWALLAGAWFVVHPGHVVTVQWIACQTELMVTVFALSAVLCYARWSGWWAADDGAPAPRGGPAWLAGALAFFALGLGCRENAIVVPAVALLGDVILRGGVLRRRGRWGAYAAFVLLFGLYFALRQSALGGFPLPGRPYLIRPTDPEFLAFVTTKFLYYLLGLFGYLPVVPIGGVTYLQAHPGFFYSSLLMVGGGVVVGAVSLRRHRGVWLAGLWMLGAIGVMSPVFASPHHLYLPGVGAAIFFAAGLAQLAGALRLLPAWRKAKDGPEAQPTPVRPARRGLAAVLVTLHIVLLPVVAIAFGWAYRTGTRIEDEVIREIVTLDLNQRPLREGDHLFFLNLPLFAYYVKPALENRFDIATLHGHVLTFSPTVLGLEQPCTVQQIDEHAFTIALERPDYLAGRAGLAILDAMDRTEPYRTGDVIENDLYDVTVVEATPDGVAKLKFTFRQPLDDPAYRFYFGSRKRFAYPLRFGGATEVAATTPD